MVRIYVIDNGGQWTHREWRTLRDLDVETRIVPNTTPLKELQKDDIQGLVLSGGAPRIGLDGTLGNCAEYLDAAEFPILGILRGASVHGTSFWWESATIENTGVWANRTFPLHRRGLSL